MTTEPYRYTDDCGETLHIEPVTAHTREGAVPAVEFCIDFPDGIGSTSVHVPAADTEQVITAIRAAAGQPAPVSQPTADRARALALLEAADFLRDAHFRDGLSVQEIGCALRNTADNADAMVGSFARDGFDSDEIAAMLAQPLPQPAPMSPPADDRAALREVIAAALIARIKQAVIPEPQLWQSGQIGSIFTATEFDLADAVLAALPQVAEQAAVVANLRTMYDVVSGRQSDLIDERDQLLERVAELEGLQLARYQTCTVCGSGYETGTPCTTCAFKARIAAETQQDQEAGAPPETAWAGATELASDREIATVAATGIVGYRQDQGRLLHCLAHKPAPASRYADFHEVGADDLDDGGMCVHPRCGRDLLAAWPTTNSTTEEPTQ